MGETETGSAEVRARLFTPMAAGLLAVVSGGVAIAVGVDSLFSGFSVSGWRIALTAALVLIILAAVLWYLAGREGASGPVVRQQPEIAAWLRLTAGAFAVILAVSLLPIPGIGWARLLLVPAAFAMLYFLGSAQRVTASEEWLNRVQEWSPVLGALFLATGVLAGCLGRGWAVAPLFALVLADTGVNVARYQAADAILRERRDRLVMRLRRATNGAMLVRTIIGTIFVAMFIGVMPAYIPVVIVIVKALDRLLLQVSLAMIENGEPADQPYM